MKEFFKNNHGVLYHGDCLEIMDSLPQFDIVVTSPPYADRRKGTYGGVHSSKYIEWFSPIARKIKQNLSKTGSFFLNIKAHCDKGERDLYVMKLVISLRENLGFRFVDEFSWTKLGVPGKFKGRFKNAFEPIYHFSKEKNFTHNPYAVAHEASDVSKARYKRKACGESSNGSGLAGMRKEITNNLALPSNHIHFVQKSNQHTKRSKHPAVYPIELCEFFIQAYSNVGDVVFDPFGGSGTTAVAAQRTGRKWVLIEKELEYCEIIADRLKGITKPTDL